MAIKVRAIQPEDPKSDMANSPRRQHPEQKLKPTTKPAGTPVDTAVKRGRGRPKTGNETITIRLSTKAINQYRLTGKGWRARLQADIQKSIEE